MTLKSCSPIESSDTSRSAQECSVQQSLPLEDISKLLDDKLAIFSPFMKTILNALAQDMKQLVFTIVKVVFEELMRDFTQTTDFIIAEQSDLKAKILDRNKKI